MQKIGELPTKLPETKNLSYEETETIETSVSSELALNGNSVINSGTKQGPRGKKDKKNLKKKMDRDLIITKSAWAGPVSLLPFLEM